jgi:hypothetical protein
MSAQYLYPWPSSGTPKYYVDNNWIYEMTGRPAFFIQRGWVYTVSGQPVFWIDERHMYPHGKVGHQHLLRLRQAAPTPAPSPHAGHGANGLVSCSCSCSGRLPIHLRRRTHPPRFAGYAPTQAIRLVTFAPGRGVLFDARHEPPVASLALGGEARGGRGLGSIRSPSYWPKKILRSCC